MTVVQFVCSTNVSKDCGLWAPSGAADLTPALIPAVVWWD